MAARSSESDEALAERVAKAMEGDFRAFDELVERHREGIVTNCRYLTRSADDAEDLAQDIFVKALFGIRGFEGRSQFRTWLQRIKVNHCLNFLERRRRVTFVNVDDPALEGEEPLTQAPDTAQAHVSAKELARIGAVLDSIPETLRIPLILCDHDGMEYQEIADSLNLSLSATKMRIKRGREAFRARYGSLQGLSANEP